MICKIRETLELGPDSYKTDGKVLGTVEAPNVYEAAVVGAILHFKATGLPERVTNWPNKSGVFLVPTGENKTVLFYVETT
jgi:hypothetical protein